MVFKTSLEINNDKVTIPTKRSFLKILYNVCKTKKNIFEQHARIHLDGPKITDCETVSDTVFVLNFSFTSKYNHFRAAIDEACEAFTKMMQDFGCTQKLEIYDPHKHQANSLQQIHYTNFECKLSSLFISQLDNFSSSFEERS